MSIRKWALRLWMLPLAASMVVAAPTLLYSAPNTFNSFSQQNLVSDIPGLAAWTDQPPGSYLWQWRKRRSTNVLYFTAWLNQESDGLFGSIATPEPGTLTLLGTGLVSLIGYGRRKGKRTA